MEDVQVIKTDKDAYYRATLVQVVKDLCKDLNLVPPILLVEVARTFKVQFGKETSWRSLCEILTRQVDDAVAEGGDKLDALVKMVDEALERYQFIKSFGAHTVRWNGMDSVFTILKKLGQGNYGTVHEAVLQENLVTMDGRILQKGLKVAVKTQDLQRTKARYFVGLMNEIEALRRIKACPNVNDLFDVFYNPDYGVLIYIMELVKGRNLLIFVRQDPDFEVLYSKGKDYDDPEFEDVLLRNFILPLREGLLCMHDSNVTHRDIKLDNMMFNARSNKTMWIDFGLACVDVCAPYYDGAFPPEMYPVNRATISKNADAWKKSDTWFFGCAMYEMITMRPYPIQRKIDGMGGKEKVIVEYIAEQARMNPDLSMIPNVFPTIRRLFDRWLQVDPEKRKL